MNILDDLYHEKEFNSLSEWLLLSAKWTLFQLYHGSSYIQVKWTIVITLRPTSHFVCKLSHFNLLLWNHLDY